MKKLIVIAAAALVLASPLALYAACTTNIVYLPDGRYMTCVTCCYGNGQCTTNCM